MYKESGILNLKEAEGSISGSQGLGEVGVGKMLVPDVQAFGYAWSLKHFAGGPVADWAPDAGVPGSIPSQRTRSHMLQVKIHLPQLRLGTAK